MRLIFICLFVVSLEASSLFDRLQAIPSKDRLEIERFFSYLLCENEFGYTLFGNKPISIAAVSAKPNLSETDRFMIEKGWNLWLKYRHLFPSNRFILKRDILGENQCVTISIINKSLVYKAIKNNLEIFQKYLGTSDVTAIFERICEGDRCIFDLATPHPQAVIGILLGYGVSNALNFQRESELFEGLHRQSPPLASDKIDHDAPNFQTFLKAYGKPKYRLRSKVPSIVSFHREMKEIFETRKSFGMSEYLDKFETPGFACWDSSETENLKDEYKHTRAVIRDAYKNGSFLETTLKQWMASDETDTNSLAVDVSNQLFKK